MVQHRGRRSPAGKVDGWSPGSPIRRAVSRSLVHQGRIFRIEVDTVTLPTGHTLDMEIVRHPGSVVLLPMPSPDQIILIRQYRYSIDRYHLGVARRQPEAGRGSGCCRGARVRGGDWPACRGRMERLKGFYPTPGFCDELMTYYRCTELRPPAPDSTATEGRRRGHRAAHLHPRGGAGADCRWIDCRPEDGGGTDAALGTTPYARGHEGRDGRCPVYPGASRVRSCPY